MFHWVKLMGSMRVVLWVRDVVHLMCDLPHDEILMCVCQMCQVAAHLTEALAVLCP